MPTPALELASQAYKHHNLNELTTFNSTEFPYSIGLDIVNDVIRSMNRLGSFYFMEMKTALPYTPGNAEYDLTALGIDPQRITQVTREADNYWGEVLASNWTTFKQRYRFGTVQTAQPSEYAKYNTTLYLSAMPDQDYGIYVYHYKDMPKITGDTDNVVIPERDEDALIEGCYQWLGYRTGRWDYATAYAVLQSKVAPMLVSLKQDAGLPRQMPAAF